LNFVDPEITFIGGATVADENRRGIPEQPPQAGKTLLVAAVALSS
jgi:hypothetical protein